MEEITCNPKLMKAAKEIGLFYKIKKRRCRRVKWGVGADMGSGGVILLARIGFFLMHILLI